MKQLADEVFMLHSSKKSHVYLIHGNKNILIDTGFPGCPQKIVEELQAAGITKLDAIFLTHHDVDHVGNVSKIANTMGGEIFISSPDYPYLMGAKNRPGIKHRTLATPFGCEFPPPRPTLRSNQFPSSFVRMNGG